MIMKNSHTTANDKDCGLACISKMPIGRINVTIELSKTVKAINVSPDIYEIFDITGFAEMLDAHKR